MNNRTSLKNLVSIISAGGMPLSTLSVYVYYLLRNEEPTTYKQIKKDLLLSTASVNRHNRVLAALGALIVDSSPGRATIYKPKGLDNDRLKNILAPPLKGRTASAHRYSSSLYYNNNIKKDIYNRMFKYRRQEERAGSVPARDVADANTPELNSILNALPSNQKGFKVNPSSMKRLRELSSKIDVVQYIKWFVKVKLGRLIPRFNMGIFLYSGMVDEYKVIAKRLMKVEKYKTVTKRLKNQFDDRAKKFKEEMKK
jgi:hypothetical protein